MQEKLHTFFKNNVQYVFSWKFHKPCIVLYFGFMYTERKKQEGIGLGVYLDSRTGYDLYKNETEKPYFVDKTLLLEELFPLVDEGSNYICVTRPRRFGKTVMANMIAAFFPEPVLPSRFLKKEIYQR